MFSNIILEKRSRIAKITLNRPEAMNSVNKETHLELQKALEDIEKDSAILVVILTGSGRAFCAGADLKYIKGVYQIPSKMAEFIGLWHTTCNAIEALSKPVIAAVNGMALAGGLELIEACDIAIASDSARLGDQHANFGLLAGGGGTQRLPRLIGIRKAKELILTGDWVSPQDAVAIGLINKVVPADKLEETVNEIATKIADRSPMASKTAKYLINRGMQTDLSTALELEKGVVLAHFGTEDAAEGLSAFMERRTPVFKGK